jgi:hypothetical protein
LNQVRHLSITELFDVAIKYANNDSVKLCIEDADKCVLFNRPEYAKLRLKKSLQYSIGILHPEYQKLFGDN